MFVLHKKMVANSIKIIEVIEKYDTATPLLPGVPPISGKTNPVGATCTKAEEVRRSVTGVPSEAAWSISSC